MKVLETQYNGYLFRSRLEARWAVFMDYLNIPYEYEKEGFDLGDGIWYLPDFWLPDQKMWLEIKGLHPSDEELDKAFRLSTDSGRRACVLYGDIGDHGTEQGVCFGGSKSGGYMAFPATTVDFQYRWCECQDCGMLDIQFEGRGDRIPCGHLKGKSPCYDTENLLDAYSLAKAERFTNG